MISTLEPQNLGKEILKICNSDYKFFFSKPNVEGIALGYKYINEINTFNPSIHVFVRNKLASNMLPCNALIPSIYKGFKTDIIESGRFIANDYTNETCYLNSFNSTPYTQKIRPIQPSYCMSLSSSSLSKPRTGTFGYIATDNLQINKTYCLLSTNGTFADFNLAQIGSAIIQPSVNFGGDPKIDTVANLLRFQFIKFNNQIPNTIEDFNTIDAAIASFRNIGQVQLINPFIPKIGVPIGTTPPEINKKIQWTGCFSGYQNETINSIGGIIKIEYQSLGSAWFKDITIATGSSQTGDKGALVCDMKKNALGLLFGSTSFYDKILICTINNIIKNLNITLLTT